MENKPTPEPPSLLLNLAGTVAGCAVIVSIGSLIHANAVVMLIGSMAWGYMWARYLIQVQKEKYQRALDNYWKRQL